MSNPVRSSGLGKVKLRNGLFISRPEGLPCVRSQHSDSSAEDPAFLTPGGWKVGADHIWHSFFCTTDRKIDMYFSLKKKPKQNKTKNR